MLEEIKGEPEVSEELNSVETVSAASSSLHGIAFQKNLIVWKLQFLTEPFRFFKWVSEELNSVETPSGFAPELK